MSFLNIKQTLHCHMQPQTEYAYCTVQCDIQIHSRLSPERQAPKENGFPVHRLKAQYADFFQGLHHYIHIPVFWQFYAKHII